MRERLITVQEVHRWGGTAEQRTVRHRMLSLAKSDVPPTSAHHSAPFGRGAAPASGSGGRQP